MPTALYFTSERKTPRNDEGWFISCRVIAAMSATGIASGNDCFLRRNGRHRGLSGRVKLAIRGMRAPDGNWREDAGFSQADVDEMQQAMFPQYPMPILVGTEDWWSLFTHLPNRKSDGSYTDGKVINIALRLSALPANDPARKYTSADHQVTLRARKKVDGVWWIKRVDPMRPQDSNYQGDWVKASSIKKAAQAILGGIIIAEIYGDDGEWSDADLVRKYKDGVIAAKDADLSRIAARRDEWKAEAKALEGQLTECREDRPDVTAALDAVQERFINDLMPSVREDYE